MNHKFYICYDLETDSPNPEEAHPTEIAAVPIEPRSLKILADETFNVIVQPPDLNEKDYFENHSDTIHWHASNHKVEAKDMLEKWKKEGVEQKLALQEFNRYCKQFEIEKTSQNWYVDPIPVGYNIIGFDNKILQRICQDNKVSCPFSFVNQVDIMHLLFTWFENIGGPSNFKMDTLREFFQMPHEGTAHEALTDVIDTARIFVRFLQFQRKQAHVKKFKGAFNGV